MPAALLLLVLFVAFVAGCARGDSPVSRGPVSPPPASSAVASRPPEPLPVEPVAVARPELATPSPLVPLAVPGFKDAVVSLPDHATGPRPLVIALHGNYDRPEWQCDVWRQVTKAVPFVLCPRGEPRTDAPRAEDRWTWGSYARVEREVVAAVEALRSAYPGWLAEGPTVLTGFSLGAAMAARVATHDPAAYPRVVLVEGGHDVWHAGTVRDFVARGGLRVLGACGQPACVERLRRLGRAFESGRLDFRAVSGGAVGHTYGDAVAVAVTAEWPWLCQGDARFAAPP